MSLPSLACKYVTQECLREWKSGETPNFRVTNPVPPLRFLYELCWTTVKGELPIQKFKVAIDSVEFSEKLSAGALASVLADIVTQSAQDYTMPGEYRIRLIKLAKWLVESTLVPMRLFQERCEEEFLWDAEMIKIKAQDLKSKEVRVNTRLLYQQTKFNLLREESEGYAKLITLLCRGSEDISQTALAAIIGIIKSLIGHFDLDPNRVFDIVLDCFELQPDNDVFLQLIPIFPRSHASQILGFKFQYYQRMEVVSPVPFGLCKLSALLVREGFMDLGSVYGHLLPKDEEAFELYNSLSSKRLDEANNIGKINLAAIGKDLMDDEKQGDVTIDLFAALNMEADALADRSSEFENNQKLGLLRGFLSVDDWYHAYLLFERLSPLNPVAYTQICDGLFRLIEKQIVPAYKIIRETHIQSSGSPNDGSDALNASFDGQWSKINLPKEFFQMLLTVGPYLFRDTMLLQKVCRVLKCYLSSAEALATEESLRTAPDSEAVQNIGGHLRDARSRVEGALGSCLLPSLQLIPANPGVGQEIWEVMSLLPYEARYRLYGEWERDSDQNPMLLAARQTAKLDTRRILKRLAKENLKQLGRMVAKLAHANPMTVLRTIVHQIEAYRDMITPVVDAFKYLTQLEYDILEYVVIERLAQSGRDKLKDDGLNLSDWLQSLASFWGHLCKKYPSMELRGLFQYLVNQLKKGNGIELVVLQELIQQMANVQYSENLTEEQLDAMAGSETLRYQATSYGVTRNNKALVKSTNRLRDSLLPKDEPKLAIPLLLLIAQHRSVVVINADAPYIKMVSEQFDRCHGTLLQYVEFLCGAISPPATYAQLIPSLNDLVHLYHLDPEVAFLLYRPVMRLFKCDGASNAFWPLDSGEIGNASSIDMNSEHAEDNEELILDLGPSGKRLRWNELLETVKSILPAKAWNSLSPDLYATFWGLTLYDLYVPRNRYEAEIAKQHAALKTLEELADNSSSAITKRKKDKERIQESLDRLTTELKMHEENVASVHRRLSREKDKWLSLCPDTLKINMEFLQRCIFPRCTFSMPDAVYCAMFVHTLHSLGTPFFNTVNHIDVLICKTLHPMICCCTEYEAGRLGRFLYETLKIAYHWKSDESIYERECGNMPGFAVYYRFPNSQRVTFGQFVKVHWKWSQRISRLLIQSLESTEYMEIRNALILLTKISGVFPVTKRSGINIEKRVSRIKNDEREDLKVLATGVAAALASRKPSWVSDEEFGMGYIDIKPQSTVAKSSSANVVNQSNSLDSGSLSRELIPRNKAAEGKSDRPDSGLSLKSDQGNQRLKAGISVPPTDVQSSETKKSSEEPNMATVDATSHEFKGSKRTLAAGSGTKLLKQEHGKEDGKTGKTGRSSVVSTSEKDSNLHNSEGRQASGSGLASMASANGSFGAVPAKSSNQSAKVSEVDNGPSKFPLKEDQSEAGDFHKHSSRIAHSPRHDPSAAALKSGEKVPRRNSPAEEQERLVKRRKGDSDARDMENEKERSDGRLADLDKTSNDDHSLHKTTDKASERSKDRGYEKLDKDSKDRSDRFRGEENTSEKPRDRSLERHGRERSVERNVADRSHDKGPENSKDERVKEEKSKLRHNDNSDERFRGQTLPPPPPLPLHVVPQTVNSGRRDDDTDRRFGSSKPGQKLSPRHDERERRRSEESLLVSQDEAKRRRDEDFRERIREERDGLPLKIDDRDREREREKEKTGISKEEMDGSVTTKRRKLKRDHMASGEAGEFSPVGPASVHNLPQPYDGRDRGDRKGVLIQRAVGYMEEPSMRIHAKDAPNKLARRDPEPMYEREWDDEKRQRADQKRRHRK